MKHFAFVMAALCLAACGQPKTVLVQGVGSVERDPEFATISAEVSADAETVDAAVAESSRRVDVVTKGLKDFGVKAEQVHADSFGVSPKCDYDNAAGKQVCHGYESNHVLAIEVSDFDRLGVVLGALAQLGVERIDDTGFNVRDMSALGNEARQAAMSDAQAKARLYAESNGMMLGAVLGIEDREASQSRYSRYDRRVQDSRYVTAPTNAIMQVTATRRPITRVPLTVQKVTDQEQIYMEFELVSKK